MYVYIHSLLIHSVFHSEMFLYADFRAQLLGSAILLFLKALQKEEIDPRFLVRMQGGPISCQRSASRVMSNVTVCVRISTTWCMFFFCPWESSINLAGDLL